MSDEGRFTEKTECAHCGNLAPMAIEATVKKIAEYFHEGISWNEGFILEITACPACDQRMLRKLQIHDGREPDRGVVAVEVLYPVSPEIPLGLPDSIEKGFRSALRIQAVDPNAYGVLLGRVVDLVCSDRKAEGSTMFERLEDLADRGEIPEKLSDVAQKLRKMRNIGANADLGELTEDDVPVLDRLCRALLDYVYSAPALVEEAAKKLSRVEDS